MKLYYLHKIDSTQTYLKTYIKQNNISQAICFYTYFQTNGIGSRDNNWQGKKGNLFFSFAIPLKQLPKDLPLGSSSIFFSYILKEELQILGSNVWIKWPNDFYKDEKKFGGTITQADKDYIYCGIGINLLPVSTEYGCLDIKIDAKNLLENYFQRVKKEISWKQIFSKYRLEFERSRRYKTTIENEKVSLQNALLLDDGSIEIDGKKVFSLR